MNKQSGISSHYSSANIEIVCSTVEPLSQAIPPPFLKLYLKKEVILIFGEGSPSGKDELHSPIVRLCGLIRRGVFSAVEGGLLLKVDMHTF